MFVQVLQRSCHETLFAISAWLICNSVILQTFNQSEAMLHRAIYSFSFTVAFVLLVLFQQRTELSKGLRVFAGLNAFTYIAMLVLYVDQIA